MQKNTRWIIIVAALAVLFVAGAIAQQKSDDKAVDPVCGMTLVKANAKATYDYKGTTYYFCNPGCKDAFVKDPEKYLKAQAEAKAAVQTGQMGMMKHDQAMGQGMGQGMMGQNCPMMQQGGQMACGMGMLGRGGMMMRHGRMGMMGRGGMMAPGMGQLFSLYGDKIEVTVENTKDGAMLKVTSKDPEVVKAIQVHMAEHMAMMKKMKDAQAKAPAAPGAGQMPESGCGDGCPMKKK